MKPDAFDEIRKDFEKNIGTVLNKEAGLAREESGAYRCQFTELAFRSFLAGYLIAFEQMIKMVDFKPASPSEPTFTVTPDARERAEAYQSVNPDYPSPATYQEAE